MTRLRHAPIDLTMTTQGTAQKSRRRVGRARQDAPGAVIDDLHRMALTFADDGLAARRTLAQARKRAKARAGELAEGAEPDTRVALLFATAELFDTLRLELAASPQKASRLIERFEETTGMSRLALSREVLRAPEVLSLPLAVAAQVQLAMLLAFAPVRNVSLWTLDEAAQAYCALHVGKGAPSRGAKELARCLLGGGSPEPGGARRLLLGMAIGHGRQPDAALICCAKSGARDECSAFLVQAIPVLTAVLERDLLLAGNAASERAIVGSSERRLTRLGFDLHDGPIQEVALLAQDLRDLRDQLKPKTPAGRELAVGALDELDARMLALDTALRRISNEVRSASVLLNRPFSDALQDVAHAFAARVGFEPRLTIKGDMGLLSGSQQIALLNIIQEALSNVRQHSRATAVQIYVSAGQTIEVRVTDNGDGFELEAALMKAAQKGRLGLVAMHERVRLLGGQCRIDSRPGGPTVVAIELERWEPVLSRNPD